MILSPDQLAQVKRLTDRAYQYLHPDVRLYLNEQLLEYTAGWQVTEWLERLEATARYYEEERWLHAGTAHKRSSGRKKTDAGFPTT